MEQAMARKQRTARAVTRDAVICARVPESLKRDLWDVAQKKLLDPSAIILQFVNEGVQRLKRELQLAVLQEAKAVYEQVK